MCAVDFMNICGNRNVPQIKHVSVMFQAERMVFLRG